jgi:hypothetical protein
MKKTIKTKKTYISFYWRKVMNRIQVKQVKLVSEDLGLWNNSQFVNPFDSRS